MTPFAPKLYRAVRGYAGRIRARVSNSARRTSSIRCRRTSARISAGPISGRALPRGRERPWTMLGMPRLHSRRRSREMMSGS